MVVFEMNKDFENKEYREGIVDSMIHIGIAFQIKALRKRQNLTQRQLGERIGGPQNIVSRYENAKYAGFTIKTLQRLATAFDVALIVKFATFDELDELMQNRSQEILAVTSFEKRRSFT